MIIDFHSHVLPNMDDGARSCQEAVELLTMSKEQGVDLVVATPHYYDSQNSVTEFINRRNEAYNNLQNALRAQLNESVPILVGAEVALTPTTGKINNLKELCIENTDCILIELPFCQWNDWIYQAIFQISAQRQIVPILAHVERYVRSKKELYKLQPFIDMGVFMQINASSVINREAWKVIKYLLKHKLVSAIGSDMHTVDKRPSEMEKACSKIARKCGAGTLMGVMEKTKRLLNV